MILAQGSKVKLRTIGVRDLKAATRHKFTLSITEPMTDPDWARSVLDQTGFWTNTAGACAIEADDRLIGTLQFYGAGPGVHGLELGYILHDEADRGKGYASEALRLFSDLLFAEHPECHRLQLIIETWNDASARLAENCGYASEGILRKAGYSSPDQPADCFVYSRVRD
ncbi:GNAT family protein [Phenylobacterium sp.]|uniref:GNAT family N-acetyltransferase n=1 Tax=Phenylobacterium sp. TaxID=1871053 RepID=UPI00120A29AB|nr:GNAT family protein [Phenylobacterium sp.]THD63762.1 MAG: N-acetyltransferase [Phenylobacterium sp.]